MESIGFAFAQLIVKIDLEVAKGPDARVLVDAAAPRL